MKIKRKNENISTLRGKNQGGFDISATFPFQMKLFPLNGAFGKIVGNCYSDIFTSIFAKRKNYFRLENGISSVNGSFKLNT